MDSSLSSLVDSLNWRYATKSFAPRAIPPAHWRALEEVLRLSPSAYGLQPWRFVVVRDPELKDELRAYSFDQPQVAECSHLVVFAAHVKIDERYLDEFLESIAEQRNVSLESLDGYRRLMHEDLLAGNRGPLAEWAAKQTYLALGNLLTAAALARIDACPLEGIAPARYDEALGLADTPYRSQVACALGYRAEGDLTQHRRKVRFSAERLFAHPVAHRLQTLPVKGESHEDLDEECCESRFFV